MALFNLAQSIGLDDSPFIATIRHDSAPIRHENAVNSDDSVNRWNRHDLNANNDGLPDYHYRGEDLTSWMESTDSAKRKALKYGDSSWIEAKLRRVPLNQRQSICNGYSERYKVAFDFEPDEVKKVNRARVIANSWLLKTTK